MGLVAVAESSAVQAILAHLDLPRPPLLDSGLRALLNPSFRLVLPARPP